MKPAIIPWRKIRCCTNSSFVWNNCLYRIPFSVSLFFENRGNTSNDINNVFKWNRKLSVNYLQLSAPATKSYKDDGPRRRNSRRRASEASYDDSTGNVSRRPLTKNDINLIYRSQVWFPHQSFETQTHNKNCFLFFLGNTDWLGFVMYLTCDINAPVVIDQSIWSFCFVFLFRCLKLLIHYGTLRLGICYQQYGLFLAGKVAMLLFSTFKIASFWMTVKGVRLN